MDSIVNFIKKFAKLIIAIVVFLILLIVITSLVSSSKNKKCNSLKEEILNVVDNYVNTNNLLPTLNGTSIVINLEDLGSDISFKNSNVTGTVTYTKYNEEIIKTFDIKNAGYCSTGKFKKESTKYNKNVNTKVNVYFNYKKVESYNSKWSNWIESSKISDVATDGVYLPIDSKELPVIPNDAIITEYVVENSAYYSYRDQKWKWYKNNIMYSDYSSEKPDGYSKKDEATVIKTEYTEWSLDYPEVHDYRNIKTTTGYQWYKAEGKNKIYWENGKYAPESPGKEYKKDKSAKMYSYSDSMWKWYNGDTKRIYSSPSSVKPNGYNYKDEDTLTYSNWSKFITYSSLTNENMNYREEKTDLYSRYLIKYDVYSYDVFNKPVPLNELEKSIGKSYEEIINDSTFKIEITFKFQKEA